MTPHFLEHLRPQGSWQRQGKVKIFGGMGAGREGTEATYVSLPTRQNSGKTRAMAFEIACG